MSTFSIIDKFIHEERSRFQNTDNNIFAMSFGQIRRYRLFIEIIRERYKKLSKDFTETHELYMEEAKINGNGPMGDNLTEISVKSSLLGNKLHLEIESFYMFAKILLDKVAKAVGVYFGEMPKISFESHNKFIKSIKKSNKVLEEVPTDIADRLTQNIVDFRDDHIVHKGSPRDTFGTIWSKQEGPKRVKTRIHPKPTDEQNNSGNLDELIEEIDLYIKNIIDFIIKNKDHTKLKLLK